MRNRPNPALIERYRRHCIELKPDLVIIAEGLNDMRSGMAVQDFMADLAQIVADIRRETGALVVLVGIYHQIFGRGANDPVALPTWTRWTPEVAVIYNQAVRQVAEQCGALFVDAQAVMGGADWTLNPDCCHPERPGPRPDRKRRLSDDCDALSRIGRQDAARNR